MNEPPSHSMRNANECCDVGVLTLSVSWPNANHACNPPCTHQVQHAGSVARASCVNAFAVNAWGIKLSALR